MAEHAVSTEMKESTKSVREQTTILINSSHFMEMFHRLLIYFTKTRQLIIFSGFSNAGYKI